MRWRLIPCDQFSRGFFPARYHDSMAFWCLKISEQQQYKEREGYTYVFDNRHSTRVAAGDGFVYEKKVGHGKLLFLGSGAITRVDERSAAQSEQQGGKVKRIYTAILESYKRFPEAVDISSTVVGRENRSALNIRNLNQLGLSRSVARISESLFTRINEVGGRAARSSRVVPVSLLGTEYRSQEEDASLSGPDPFAVDPSVIERGVLGHRKTQNLLARSLRESGLTPLSPAAGDPDFDIAWQFQECVFVGEVKSITASNEEKQLRLGLGQVLRYAHQLSGGVSATPVLVAECRPTDPTWQALCGSLGVILLWPELFRDLPSLLDRKQTSG